jgi:hypothetical protein
MSGWISDYRAGSGAFFGLAGYSYFSGMSQLEKQRAAILQSKSFFGMRSRRFGIVTISLGWVSGELSNSH